MVAHGAGDTKAARVCQCLQPSRDIDPVAENVALIDDDVAEIDADPEADALLLGGVSLAVEHAALRLDGTAHGIDHAGKLGQHAVAGGLLTMRPLCSRTFGSISSRRCAWRRRKVPSSSAPIRRE
jgi:hypothetical protein